jgi:multidrug efflux pump subunit AcrB
MWLVTFAMKRPVSVIMAVLAMALCSILALSQMNIDIFPKLNLPVIYVAQPYGGLDPSQIEGYVTSYYEYHFLYLPGIEHVESKSVQNMSLIKLVFHPGTDMSQAMSQTVSMVERSRAFMPPGTVAPFVMRFDAGNVPVGYLVFSSETRNLPEIQDLALFKVRPVFATLPGVSAPPPFGGNQRTVVIRVDPKRLRAYRMSADEIVKAVAAGNVILPAGNVRTGDLNRLAPVNSVVSDIQELQSIPLKLGAGPTVFLRDVATIEDASDILVGYALVDGRQTVYIPVTKRADASTLDVVNRVKAQLPRMRSLIPEDIKLDFVFDQSVYVTNSLRNLIFEGASGALLTGLMILLFLRDFRSAAIVVLTIPFALVIAVVLLWLAGQTINIMTLGGLTLAIGILVDESTVVMERIHARLAEGKKGILSVVLASYETVTARLLAMLAVFAVFIPAFFMKGSIRALFEPLSLAVGFAMLASYLLSSTLVPVLCGWFLRTNSSVQESEGLFEKLKHGYSQTLKGAIKVRWLLSSAYFLLSGVIAFFGFQLLATEIFPTENGTQLQLRLRAPTGTRVERTREITLKALDAIADVVGKDNVALTLGYVGTQPPSYPISAIYLWTSGPHESVLSVELKETHGIKSGLLKERIRQRVKEMLPNVTVSFEPGDIVSRVMNFGALTPLEVVVSGPNFAETRRYAEKVLGAVQHIGVLRDVQIAQPLDYPTVEVKVDRERAGQMGVTVEQVGRSLVAATSSSRFIVPNYWRDPKSGVGYQVQVEVPQYMMQSVDDVKSVPATLGAAHPLVGDVARVEFGNMPGEYDRYNMQRMITITANIANNDLGKASAAVSQALKTLGTPPRGVAVNVRGQVEPLNQAMSGLSIGLVLAVLVIFIMLAGVFQSVRLACVVVCAIPAVWCGAILAMLVTGTSVNIQSFIGTIMATGIGVANAILLVAFAEKSRKRGKEAVDAAVDAGTGRLRPIMMTSLAMIAGMTPMAIGFGEGGEQTAPLGRAVIGGLLASFPAVVFVLPAIFSLLQAKVNRQPASLIARLDQDELAVAIGEAE